MQICIFSCRRPAALHIFERRSDHCPLAFVHMPAPKVETDNVAYRVGPFVCLKSSRNSRIFASAKAISAIQNSTVEQNDWLAKAVRAHIRHESVKLCPFNQGEYLRKRMK
jgi:hypothetical protein